MCIFTPPRLLAVCLVAVPHPNMQDKPLTKGGRRSQEGEQAVKLKGNYVDAVRWRFKVS